MNDCLCNEGEGGQRNTLPLWQINQPDSPPASARLAGWSFMISTWQKSSGWENLSWNSAEQVTETVGSVRSGWDCVSPQGADPTLQKPLDPKYNPQKCPGETGAHDRCSREELNLSLPWALFTCKAPAWSVATSLARLLLPQRCCIHWKGLPAVLTPGGLIQQKAYKRISGQRSSGPCYGTITLKQRRCKLAIAVLGYCNRMSKPQERSLLFTGWSGNTSGFTINIWGVAEQHFSLSEFQCIIRRALPSLASAPAVSPPSPLPTAAWNGAKKHLALK